MGTLSLLAGIDLHDGHVFAQVKERHRSLEFTEFLQQLHEYYAISLLLSLIIFNWSRM